MLEQIFSDNKDVSSIEAEIMQKYPLRGTDSGIAHIAVILFAAGNSKHILNPFEVKEMLDMIIPCQGTLHIIGLQVIPEEERIIHCPRSVWGYDERSYRHNPTTFKSIADILMVNLWSSLAFSNMSVSAKNTYHAAVAYIVQGLTADQTIASS